MLRRLLPLALLVVLVVPARAGERAEIWERFAHSDPMAKAGMDHSAWGRLLAVYVRPDEAGINRIAYARLVGRDRERLDDYLAELQDTAVSRLRREQQLAYWINLYNALTVRVVLDHYPVKSIQDIDISPGLFSRGPWKAKLAQVEGETVSLDDIEHRILRPIWRDARIHYALNCASLGCPNLRVEPYEADRIDRQLDSAALHFINSKRAVWMEGEQLHVSSLYMWYKDDFGGDEHQVIKHLMGYAEPGLATRLQSFTRIDGKGYDWRLNDAQQ